MKIIKEGTIPDEIDDSWWDGCEVSCLACGMVAILESGDYVQRLLQITGDGRRMIGIYVNCPTCNTPIHLKRKSPTTHT
jgi:hypothetical protein